MTKPGSAESNKRKARKPFLRPADTADLSYQRDIGDPGGFPYTRGIYPEMYRTRPWTIRQYAGYGTAEESNLRYKYLLSQGTTGLSVAFDLPTQIGLDSDHPLAVGEVGRVGVAIDSRADMERLFKDIPLDSVSTSMTINATAPVILATYLVTAKQQRVPWKQLRGTVQNDILKEYVARGTYIYPPKPSLRLATDLLSFCSKEVPRWNTISIGGYHMREAGATAAQELAFTLANGEAYVQAALKSGLSVDEFAPRLSFFFSSHSNLLEEIAKFRAARRLWARLMKERYGAVDRRSMVLRFHTQTAGSTLTAQQPDNNVVRVAFQALAAVLGGTQSLHTNAKDEALALPSQESATLALRTQQILAHETKITESADPLGGSWLVERLTAELEEEAQALQSRIASRGGVLRAIESGYIQREIQEAAFSHQKKLESKEETVVGLNRFAEGRSSPSQTLQIDKAFESRQLEELRALRKRRDGHRARHALERIRQIATTSENLMPSLIEAVESYATIGEISSALRDVFGEHREAIVI
jgi:methylmalonyl-CoA mutase N-terminal domain/subunit